jgi:CBS domain-containing protein
VAEAIRQIENDKYSTYPVVDERGDFVGMVTEVRLRRTAAEGGGERRVRTIVQHTSSVEPEHSLVRAVVRMEKSGVRHLGVVDRKDGNKLIGLLTMSDVIRVQAQAALAAGDPDRTTTPDLSAAAEIIEPVEPLT